MKIVAALATLGLATQGAEAGAAVGKQLLLANVRTRESDALRTASVRLSSQLQRVADSLPSSSPTVQFLRTLRLCGRCDNFKRIGEHNDGGYVMCMDGLNEGLVGALSYGVNGFDGWGMSVAQRYNVPLHEYDCTNLKQPSPCPGCDVHFHGECIDSAKSNGAFGSNYRTLSQQLADVGFDKAKEGSLLLKIDVEGAEWKVFAEEPLENLKKFREIVVEYHSLGQTEQHPLYLQAVKKIEEAGFSVAHLHGNNYGSLAHFGEYSAPDVLEVTYVRGTGCSADNVPYRLAIDEPNNAGAPELSDAKLPA